MIKKELIQIILTNDKIINLELYPEIAPITVTNFLNLIDKKYFDGVIFHRIIKDFMIQTGGYLIKDNCLIESEPIPSIKGEFLSNGIQNDLKHELGVISMARTNVKDSATSQFFICAANCSWLDGNYASFGKTVGEEDNKVVLEIANMQTGQLSPAFTDFPIELIGIKTIKRVSDD